MGLSKKIDEDQKVPTQCQHIAGLQYPIHTHLICADVVLPGTPNHVESASTGHHCCRAHSLQERLRRLPRVGEGVIALHTTQALQSIKATHHEQLGVRTRGFPPLESGLAPPMCQKLSHPSKRAPANPHATTTQ